ncbi:hypothetical protein ABIE49_000331 [Bradyrhizobium sp. OAE829]
MLAVSRYIRRGVVIAIAWATVGSVANAQAPAPAPKQAQIDRNGVIILVRSALLALDQANKTGNYTVLRDLGAPAFQVNTAARLAEIFAAQRRDNVDLSGVAVIDPQLSLLPQIEANGMMRMAGFFPSVPTQVNFELTYAPVGVSGGCSAFRSISVLPRPCRRRSCNPPPPRPQPPRTAVQPPRRKPHRAPQATHAGARSINTKTLRRRAAVFNLASQVVNVQNQ